MKAVVLAAGRGERLWPLTENRPKHLLPVAGRAILERTIAGLVGAGVRDIIMVVNYMADAIESRLEDGARFGCSIKYVRQKRIGGTADAVAAARPAVGKVDFFLAMYGDDYYAPSAIKRFVGSSQRRGVMVASAEVRDASRFGTLEVKRGLVTGINEKVAEAGPGRVNAGLYCFNSDAFSAVEKTKRSSRGEFELTDSLRILIGQGERVKEFALKDEEWVGISYPWDLLEANRLALDSEPRVRRGVVEANVHAGGKVIVSRGARVMSGCYIEGPVFIGEEAVVGPNSYLRPGVSLGRSVKVGAGCEVKNSILLDHVKVPHLSYVGDSILGQRAELGAGTITANLRFDDASVKSTVKGLAVRTGRRKFGAVLGDEVRTGINVSIFPGVKIGMKAWIGPGAVVKRDVPSSARLR